MTLAYEGQHHAVEAWRCDVTLGFCSFNWRCIFGNVCHPESTVSHCRFNFRAGQDCIITSECGCIIYEVDQSNLTQKITDRNVFTHSVACNYPVNVPSVINRHGIAHHSVIIIKRVQPVSNLIVINRAGTVTGISVFHVFFHMVWRVYA